MYPVAICKYIKRFRAYRCRSKCKSGIISMKVIVSESECRYIYTSPTQSFTVLGVIQCIRTWAVWRRNKAVGAGLAILMIILFVSQCILVNRYVRSIECSSPDPGSMMLSNYTAGLVAPPPFAEFRGCFVTKTRADLWVCYVLITVVEFGKHCWRSILLLLVDTIIVIFALMVISAYRSC